MLSKFNVFGAIATLILVILGAQFPIIKPFSQDLSKTFQALVTICEHVPYCSEAFLEWTVQAEGTNHPSSGVSPEYALRKEASNLKQESSRSKSQSRPLTRNDYTVGWVTALSKEQTAAMAMLDKLHPELSTPSTDSNAYILGSVGKHNVVIACLPEGQYGTNSAAVVASKMVDTFPSIKVGLLVGIGGGIPSAGVRLGDVVVGTPNGPYPGVVQWDMGKAEDGGFRRTGSLDNPPRALLTALSKLKTHHDIYGPKIPQYLDDLKKNYSRLVPKFTWSDRLKDPLSIGGQQNKPEDIRVHYGLIASGNQVIKNASIRDKLNEKLGGSLLCVEMEAAGLMNHFPCLVIRGICDYADSQKNKEWQEYTAAVAAAYAKELIEVLHPSDLDTERPISEVLGYIRETVFRIESRLEESEDRRMLNWISPSNHSTSRYNDLLKRVHNGTGRWFLESQEYQTWLESDQKALFCPGRPGAGKTFLTTIIIDDLRRRFSANPLVGIAFIYGDFELAKVRDARDLLASLLKQLARRDFALDIVRTLYEQHEQDGTEPQFSNILSILQLVTGTYSRVFIVVDAVDELQAVDNRCAELLNALFQLQQNGNVSLLVTSRLVPSIQERFDQSMSLEIVASSEDIEGYVDGQINQLPKFVHADDELRSLVKTRVMTSAEGIFLLARLYTESLHGKLTPKAMKIFLKNLPTGSGVELYEYAYNDTMLRISAQPGDRQKVAMEILSWVAFSERPITIFELRFLLAVEAHETRIDKDNLLQIEDMISMCAGLVAVDPESNIIRLIHYTVLEYFNHTRDRWFPTTEADLAKTCMSYLLLDVHVDELDHYDNPYIEKITFSSNLVSKYTIVAPTWLGNDSKDQEHFIRSYEYAVYHWGHHARKANGISHEVTAFLESNTYTVGVLCRLVLGSNRCNDLHIAAYFGLDSIGPLIVRARMSKRGIDKLDLKDITGRTPLSWAAANGYETAVQLLTEALIETETAKLDPRDRYGATPLWWAASHGHQEITQLLLQTNKVDINSLDTYNRTPLHAAVSSGHTNIVRLLLATGNADIDTRDRSSQTLLAQAARNGHETIVQLLLDTVEHQVNSRDMDEMTPLSWAARNGHIGVVRLLIGNDGVEIDALDREGNTPLILAAEYGHIRVVKLLLDTNKVVVNKQNTYRETALSLASVWGHKAIVRLLLDTWLDPPIGT